MAGEQLSAGKWTPLLEDNPAEVREALRGAENKWKKARRRKLNSKTSTLRKGSSEESQEGAVQRVGRARTVRPKEAKRRERLMVSYGPKGKMGKAEKGSGFSNKKNNGDLLIN